jgi:hypothetical protein
VHKKYKLLPAKKSQFRALAKLIADIMMDDPINLYFFEEDKKTAGKKELTKVCLFLIRFANRYGAVWATETNDVVSLFLKPNYPKINFYHLIRFNHLPLPHHFDKKSMKKTQLVQKAVKEMEKIKNKKWPHWYIQIFCIHRDLQQKGVGTYLLKEMLQIIQKENKPGYPVLLETTNPLNLPFYEKNNFHLIFTAAITEHLTQYLLELDAVSVG